MFFIDCLVYKMITALTQALSTPASLIPTHASALILTEKLAEHLVSTSSSCSQLGYLTVHRIDNAVYKTRAVT